MHRRDLLQTAPFLLAGSLGPHLAAPAGRSESDGLSRMRIAVCAYSFRTPLGSKALTYADLVHMAVKQEIDGLDLTVYWILQTLAAAGYKGYLALEYEGEEDPATAVPRYLRELKALAARYGA